MRKTTKEMIEVMQAYEDGAEIEYYPSLSGGWTFAKDPAWDWVRTDYRVKPKPREIWVVTDPITGDVSYQEDGATYWYKGNAIKFCEVMDDE